MTRTVLDCRASAPLAEAKTHDPWQAGALALQTKEKNAARVTAMSIR